MEQWITGKQRIFAAWWHPLKGGRRMTGSASAVNVVLALFLGENLLEMGGGPGGGVLKIRPDGRDSDDGKRFCDGRCVGIASRREFIGNGRGSRGRGAQNSTGSKGFGFFLCLKKHFYLHASSFWLLFFSGK